LPAPTETFRIEILEDIKKSATDQETKQLAANMVKLTRAVERLEKSLVRTAPTHRAGDPSFEQIRRDIKKIELREDAVKKLEIAVKQLERRMGELPNTIRTVVGGSRGVLRREEERRVAGRPVGGLPENRELVRQLKSLADALNRVEKSATFAGGREQTRKDIEAIAKSLTARDKSASELSKAIDNLSKKIEVVAPTKNVPAPTLRELSDVKLLGRDLKEIGADFKNIKNQLKDKIVVSFDIETSEIKKDPQGKKIVDAITQIAYQKGTLEQILKGQAEVKQILIKPPKGTRTEESFKKLIGKAAEVNKAELKTLLAEGKEADEALKEFANALKGASAVVGQNIGDFDIGILEDHFKKTGTKLDAVDSELEGFVDTLRLARKAFPQRAILGPQAQIKKPFGLEQFAKDFELAGSSAEDLGEEMHDARGDVKKVRLLLRALDGSTEEMKAAEEFFSARLDRISKRLEILTKDYERLSQKTQQAISDLDKFRSQSSDASDELKKVKKAAERTVLELADPAKIRSSIQAATFRPQVIHPRAGGGPTPIIGGEGVPGLETMAAKVGDLATSLDKLQSNIISSLEKGMSRGMEIIRNEAGEAFRLAPGGREFEIKIANVRDLTRSLTQEYGEFVRPGTSASQLVEQFIRAFTRSSLSTARSPESMAEEIIKELAPMTEESVSIMGREIQELFGRIRREEIGVAEVAGRADLGEIFKNIVVENRAQRKLNEDFIKRIAIPAVRIGAGGLGLETKLGAEKAISNFATITTGLEKFVNELKSLGAPAIEIEKFAARVGELPLAFKRAGSLARPGGPEESKAQKVAQDLINRMIELGGRQLVGRGYQRAIALRTFERRAPVIGKERATEEASAIVQKSGESVETLSQQAKDLGITALDVAKALDTIEFENIFDIIDRLFQAGKVPFLQRKAGGLGRFDDQTLRDISSIVNSVTGLLPLIEPGRPRRRAQQESVVRVLTKPTTRARPQEQERRILEVNLLWRDLADQAARLGENLIEGRKDLEGVIGETLNLSDSAGAAFKELSGHLGELNKSLISVSTGAIRGLAPFEQFTPLERQVSQSQAGIAGGIGRAGLRTPSLLSAREEALIRSGAAGSRGTGLDVLTEIRDTAETFEDQIVISGRLAKSFNKIVERLIAPAKRIAEGGEITEIQPGIKQITGRGKGFLKATEDFESALEDVTSEFQKIFGVPKTIESRADVAKIGDEIIRVLREHRGKEVEVQTAKLSEIFLNTFGRKIATRFGTKGVAITPGVVPTATKEVQKALEEVRKTIVGGAKAKVVPGAGLGYAKVPRTAGELLADIIGEEAPKLSKAGESIFSDKVLEFLQESLVKSGNKFVQELFTDASKGLVTKEEAKKQKAIFDAATKFIEEAFRVKLPTGAAGIKEIQDIFTGLFPKESLFEFQPIEARISARGVARRGLQSEVLEGIINNLIGTTTDITTLIDQVGKNALTETEEGRKRINETLQALGFEAYENIDEVLKKLKLESPDFDPSKILELANVYTTVIDEFGNKLQSFVSPKFLQTVEIPAKALGDPIKDLKLDFQSFAAFAGIFGENSELLKELAKSSTFASKEAFELIKAFQLLDPTVANLKDAVLAGLPKFSLEEIRKFSGATGTLEDFKDTIFDIAKFPTAFKLQIPSMKPGKLGFEEFFVPGPAARGTFEEPLIGERSPTALSRALSNVISAAKDVEELAAAAAREGVGLSEEFQNKFASTIRGELTKELTDTIKKFQQYETALTPENIKIMERTLDRYIKALSETEPVAPVFARPGGETQRGAVEVFRQELVGDPRQFSRVLSRISDILVGVNPASIKRESEELRAALKSFEESGGVIPAEFRTPGRLGILERGFQGNFPAMIESFLDRLKQEAEAKPLFDIQLEAGNLEEFADSVGISLQRSVEEALELRRQSLTRARASYEKALGEEVIGRKKGIEQAFLRREVPAINLKAINAAADKTEDLNKLIDTLSGKDTNIQIDIPNANSIISKLKEIRDEHEKFVKKAKEIGLPVLKEGEIAIPEAAAAKIKVRTGEAGEIKTTLKDLIEQQKRVFVESARFPFTGTLSVQPHVARLMGEAFGKEVGRLGTNVAAVPGAPRLDIESLTGILDELSQFVGIKPGFGVDESGEKRAYSLLEQREMAWSEGTAAGAERAMELTKTIESLISVINSATPKFTNLEQKLDFDGDALVIHTGQVEKSRQDIKKHFESFGKDVTSVRNLFRTIFTAIDERDINTLVEMGQAFSEKFPKEKGFEFLTQPQIRENIENLNLNEVAEALFSGTKGFESLEKGTDEYIKALNDFTKSLLEKEILPEVFTKLGVVETERAGVAERIGGTVTGLSGLGATELDRSISKLTQEILRQQLFEKRYTDAITGQLFKLQTGPIVEGISRLARISELETGFGRGMAGTGGGGLLPPSAAFLKRFPKESIALGAIPEKGEFADTAAAFGTRINEILRFVIQQGFDVKHPGVQSAANKIIENIGKKGGIESIIEVLNAEEGPLKKLQKFNEQIENEVRLRLGKHPTEALREELKRFEPELTEAVVGNLSREEIIKRVIKHVDLAATFEELGRQIQRQAVKALTIKLTEEVEALPPGAKKARKLADIRAAGGVEKFAAEQVAREAASETGISLFSTITSTLQPIYRLRTSMENIETAARRSRLPFQAQEVSVPTGEAGEKIKRDLQTAQKAANVLNRSLIQAAQEPTGGVQKLLVVSALKERFKELEELEKLGREAKASVGSFESTFGDVVKTNEIAVKVWQDALRQVGAGRLGPIGPKEIEESFNQISMAIEIAKDKMKEISQIAGLPQISPEERALTGLEIRESKSKEIFEQSRQLVEALSAQGEPLPVPGDLEASAQLLHDRRLELLEFIATMSEQFRRVSEVIKTIPAQKESLKLVFPEFGDIERKIADTGDVDKAQSEFVEEQKSNMQVIQEWFNMQTQKASDLKDAVKTTQIPEESVTTRQLEQTTSEISDAIDNHINQAILNRKRAALKQLEKLAAGPEATITAPLHEIFRASAIKAGGKYGGGTQEESILSSMLGLEDPNAILEVTGLRGTSIHRQIQKELLQQFPKAEIEKPIEDLENRLVGHLDVLYEKAGKKVVADIKTIYSPKQFDFLKQISDEIQHRGITIQEKLDELKSKEITSYVEQNVIRRLEDYLSQVNVYLKNVENSVGEIIVVSTHDPFDRFTLPIGEFDPERFDKDLEAIESARLKVLKILTSVELGVGLPKETLSEFPKIYQELADRLAKTGPKGFLETLPTVPLGEVQRSSEEILNSLDETQEKLFDQLSKEYLELFEALGGPGRAEKTFGKLFSAGGAAFGAAGGAGGATPPPPPPGGFGGGFDDDEEFKKRIEAILAKMREGVEPDVPEIVDLIKALEDEIPIRILAAQNRRDAAMAKALEELSKAILQAIEESGSTVKSFKKIVRLFDQIDQVKKQQPSPQDINRLRTPEIVRQRPDDPQNLFTNLKALFETAIRVNKLADPSEIEKFGPEIAELIGQAAERGPVKEITDQIADAVNKKKGGMAIIWQYYKKAVGDYFVNRLNALSEEINAESGTPRGRAAFAEFEQVLEKYLANIRGTLGRASDIYTQRGPTGRKDIFVEPELARLTGIYKTPAQLREQARTQYGLQPQFAPAFDVLTSDLADLENIRTPLEKIQSVFDMLTKLDPAMKEILEDADLFRRIGDQAVEAWDFETLQRGVTQLREALQSYERLQIGGFGGMGEDFTATAKANVSETIKLLKRMERMLVTGGAQSSPLGLVGVPTELDPQTQALLHRRNIAQLQKYFETPEAEGGPEKGAAFTYKQRIIDPASKQVLSNMTEEFKKIGEASNRAGEQVSLFTQRTEDLIASFQERKGLGQAFGRVLRWGIASRSVYGLVRALQSMVDTIVDVESGIAVLRQVMNPLTTDFQQITASAVSFAKEFGLPIRQVIDSMRVFAQQGLAQAEVVDRARTSALAANVTTLSAVDATEAITAATKVYRQEGESTVRFLDSWTEVEARHAITSNELANALKKAAAAAKTSGVEFDELNAIVTAIGETTRQSGKEIGTSLRFIFRRIQAEKGPKELASIGIPVVGAGGELRSTFDILGDLSDKWKDLTNAQRLNIATAIGGRRHYNSLIVLMQNWDRALSALNSSLNSKGAAERRNYIVMQTYAKQLQQVRGALVDLQIQFGKFALPVAKGLLQSIKFLLETLANIPPGIKIAALAFSGLFVAIAKGKTLIDDIINRVMSFGSVLSDFGSQFSKEFKIGIFEAFGKIPKGLGEIDTRGLSTITEAGKSIQDFESVIGKAAYVVAQFGRSWNSVMSEIAFTGTATSETLSKAFGKLGGVLGKTGLVVGTKIPVLGQIIQAAATGAQAGEGAFLELGKLFGIPAEALAKWSKENTSFVKSIAPLAGSILALIPISGKASDSIKKLAFSATQYEKSLSPIRRQLSGQLSEINQLANSYDNLQKAIDKANMASQPEAVAESIRREEFVSPLLEIAKASKGAKEFGNNLSKVNLSMVDSFDQFGNAIIKPTANLKEYFRVLKAAKIQEIAETEISALEKFSEELTNAGTVSAKFRSELKKFVKEIPAIGPILSKQIQISPAQELREAVDAVNKILERGAEFPMTTAFDELFQRYNKDLEEARERYREFFADFKRILSEISTGDLSVAQVRGLLDRETLQPAFELMTEFEERLKTFADAGKLDWEDILGIEILKKLKPEVTFDYAAPLTKDLFRQAGIIQRSQKAFAGDIVLFSDEIEKQFDIAGDQGILKYREGLGFFVEGIDKELRTVREIPFDTVSQFVDSIFPAQKISEGVQENVDILRESLVGAAAGMIGIADKEFRREFGLGPRFFEQIPTETLIQTPGGFDLGGRAFGPQPFKAEFAGIEGGFQTIVRDFFVKPLEQLEQLVEEPKRRLDAGVGFIQGLENEIQRFGTTIKNNQVVVQYIAAFVDLNKSLAESTRLLNENIAVERARNEYLKETAGLLAGLPESFSDINLGIRNFFDLTSQQRLLLEEQALPPRERTFTRLRGRVAEEDIRRQSLAGELERINRTIVQIGTIREQARAAGAVIPRDQLMSITESIAAGGTAQQGLQLDLQKDIKSNTSDTVTRLDDILAALKDPKAEARGVQLAKQIGESIASDIELLRNPRTIDRVNKALGLPVLERGIESQFNDLVRFRNLAEKRGNTQIIKAIDETLAEQSRNLISAAGLGRARGIIDPRATIGGGIVEITRNLENLAAGRPLGRSIARQRIPELAFMGGQFTGQDLISRALGGEGLVEFIQRIQGAAKIPTEEELGEAQLIRTLGRSIGPSIGVALTPFLGPAGILAAPRAAEAAAGRIEGGRLSVLAASPEFKELNQLMNDQNKTSVTNSKTLQKLFAAYGGFNEIARQAAKRQERAYDVQLRQLNEQRKGLEVKFEAGDLGTEEFRKQMQQVASEITEVEKKRDEAAKTARKRATREAVGVIASATTGFARAAGISEDALTALGTTAAGSIVAWNAWTALTGEEMPEAVKKATDSLKEMTKDMEDVDFNIFEKGLFALGKYTGLGLGAAGRAGAAARGVEKMAENQEDILTAEEKDKIRKAKDLQATSEQIKKADELLKTIKKGDTEKLKGDEKVIDVNRDQLTTLIAIEENTRKSAADTAEQATEAKKEAPVTSITKELRNKLDEIKQERLIGGGDTAAKIRDFLAAATLVTAAGYAGTKTQLSAELGEAEDRAEKIGEAFNKLVSRFPKEVEGAIADLQKRREETAESLRRAKSPTQIKSLLLDSEKAYNEFITQLESMASGIGMQLKESGEVIAKSKDQLYLLELAKDIQSDFRNVGKTIRDSITSLKVDLEFGTDLIGATKGVPKFEEIPIGKLETELTPTERLAKEGGKAFQDMIATFQILNRVRAELLDAIKKNAVNISDANVTFSNSINAHIKTIEREKSNIDKVKGEIDSLDKTAKEQVRQLKDIGPPKKMETGFFINISKFYKDLYKNVSNFFKSKPDIDTDQLGRDLIGSSLSNINKKTIELRSKVAEFNKTLDIGKLLDKKNIDEEIAKLKKSLAQTQTIGKSALARYREVAPIKPLFGVSEAVNIPEATREYESVSAIIVKASRKMRRLRIAIDDLEKFKTTPLGRAIIGLSEKSRLAAAQLNLQTNAQEKYVNALKFVNTELARLNQILAVGVNLKKLAGDFKSLKEGLEIENKLAAFTNAFKEAMDKTLGGAHPEAPVIPSFDLLQAGVPMERIFNLTREEAERAAIVGRTGRAPTLAEEQEIEFNRRLRERAYKQAKEDEKLNRQQSVATNLYRSVVEAQQRIAQVEDPRLRKSMLDELEVVRQELLRQAGEAPARGEEIAPGVFERIGYHLGTVGEQIKEVFEKYGGEAAVSSLQTTFEQSMEALRSGLPEAFKLDPVHEQLVNANITLEQIAKNTAEQPGLIASVLGKVFGSKEEVIRKAGRGTTAGGGTTGTFQMGGFTGMVDGAGGPRQDNHPVLVSSGEYVVQQPAVKNIEKMYGSGAMEVINQGQLPIAGYGGLMRRRYPMGGKIPYRFAGGGSPEQAFIQQQLAMGVSPEEIRAELGGIKTPLFDPGALVAGSIGAGATTLTGPTKVLADIIATKASRIGTKSEDIFDVAGSFLKQHVLRPELPPVNMPRVTGIDVNSVQRKVEEIERQLGYEPTKKQRRLRGIMAMQELYGRGVSGVSMSGVPSLFGVSSKVAESEMEVGGRKPTESEQLSRDIMALEALFGSSSGEFFGGGMIKRYQDGGKMTINDYVKWQEESSKSVRTEPKSSSIMDFFRSLFKRRSMQYMGGYLPESAKKAYGDKIPSFQFGGVMPEDGLAFLHKNETVFPDNENIGEKIADAIVRKLEEVKIDFNIPTTADLPELTIGNLNDLQNILNEGLNNAGTVGAARGNSAIDRFVEAAEERFTVLEQQTLSNSDNIKVLDRKSNELDDIKTDIETLEFRLESVYSRTDRMVDVAADRSYVDTAINEALGRFDTDKLAPMRAEIGRINIAISQLNNDLNDQGTIMYSNINRLGIA